MSEVRNIRLGGASMAATAAATGGTAPLQQANAEIARLQRKLLRYREEITHLRQKLEEPAYNEPESELERMQELQEESIEAEPPPPPPPPGYIKKLLSRFKPENAILPVPWPPHPLLLLWSFLGAFAGIALLGVLHQYALVPKDRDGLIPSMGASVVLLFSATASPLAQPWNTVIGHVTAAFIGVSVRQIFIHVHWLRALVWLQGAFAVSLAILCMNMLHALHPPAGATALIAIMGPEIIWHQAWLYIGTLRSWILNLAIAVLPVLVDCVFLVMLAFFWDNIVPIMTYPTSWIPFGRKPAVTHTR